LRKFPKSSGRNATWPCLCSGLQKKMLFKKKWSWSELRSLSFARVPVCWRILSKIQYTSNIFLGLPQAPGEFVLAAVRFQPSVLNMIEPEWLNDRRCDRRSRAETPWKLLGWNYWVSEPSHIIRDIITTSLRPHWIKG
jgi:hypothetical protein